MSRSRMRALLVGCAGLSIAGAGLAQSAAAAEALFREGKALLEAGDAASACPKLEQSQRLEPAVGTVALVAYCHEQQGKLASAWQGYLSAAAMARDAGQKQREQVARSKASELEPRLSKLTIQVEDPVVGVAITRGGSPVPQAEWGVALPIDPGSVDVAARASGHRAWRATIEVPPEGALLTVRVPRLEPEAPSSPARAPAPASAAGAQEEESSWVGRNALPLVAFGVGAAALGAGAYFGWRAMSKNDASGSECVDNQCTDRGLALRREALDAANVSTIASGVGLAAIGAGVLLLVAGGSDSGAKPVSVRWRVQPTALSGGAGLAAAGRF
jgi:hypothetical protein